MCACIYIHIIYDMKYTAGSISVGLLCVCPRHRSSCSRVHAEITDGRFSYFQPLKSREKNGTPSNRVMALQAS